MDEVVNPTLNEASAALAQRRWSEIVSDYAARESDIDERIVGPMAFGREVAQEINRLGHQALLAMRKERFDQETMELASMETAHAKLVTLAPQSGRGILHSLIGRIFGAVAGGMARTEDLVRRKRGESAEVEADHRSMVAVLESMKTIDTQQHATLKSIENLSRFVIAVPEGENLVSDLHLLADHRRCTYHEALLAVVQEAKAAPPDQQPELASRMDKVLAIPAVSRAYDRALDTIEEMREQVERTMACLKHLQKRGVVPASVPERLRDEIAAWSAEAAKFAPLTMANGTAKSLLICIRGIGGNA